MAGEMARKSISNTLRLGNHVPFNIKHTGLNITLVFQLLLVSTTISTDGDVATTTSGNVGDIKTNTPENLATEKVKPSQNSMIGTATINDAQITNTGLMNKTQWKRIQNTSWEEISLTDCWGISENNSLAYRSPGLFYSPNFGYVIAEKKTYQQHAYPEGQYWAKPTALERDCFCRRETRLITPALRSSHLHKNITYQRQTGPNVRHLWKWDYGPNPQLTSEVNRLLTCFTVYKAMIIRVMLTYATVTAQCSAVFWKSNVWIPEGPKIVDWDNNMMIFYIYIGNGRFVNATCTFYGSNPAFEPLETDFVVQEIDQLYSPGMWSTTSYGRGEHIPKRDQYGRILSEPEKLLAASTNIWPNQVGQDTSMEFPDWNDRIRWIEPTKWEKQTWDGEIQQKAGVMPLYIRHPSMTSGDMACKGRTAGNIQCRSPVGGVQTKLRFWDDVHYDAAGNRTRFPGHPLLLKGKGKPEWGSTQHEQLSMYRGARATIKKEKLEWGSTQHEQLSTYRGAQATIFDEDTPRDRSKRQIFAMAALIFAGINFKRTQDMEKEMNQRIDEMSFQMNERFAEDEKNMKVIADKLNELSRANYVQSERLNDVIIQMMKSEEIRQSQVQLLQDEISETQEIMLHELDTFLHTVQSVQAMSLAELAVDQMVMNTLRKTVPKPLFDRSKAYLVRIQRGVLHLQEYAKLISDTEEELNDTRRQNVQEAEELRRKLENATLDENIDQQIWLNSTNGTRIYVNTTGWTYKNISVAPINVTFGDDFFKGLGVITKTLGQGLKEVGGIFGKGLSTIGNFFGGGIGSLLWKILLPIVIVIAGLILLCCIIQIHPNCAHTKANLPTFMQVGGPTGEIGIRENNKRHKLRNFIKDAAETTALTTI